MSHSESIANIAKALAAAQQQFPAVAKTCDNPFYKSKYADLDSIIAGVKEPLAKNGLSFSQLPGAYNDGVIEIATLLMHTSGEWLMSSLQMPVAKADPQGIGSAITYGRRYALQAICGISTEDDDDANSASAPEAIASDAQQTKPKAAAKPVPRPAATGDTIQVNRNEMNVHDGTYGPMLVFTHKKPAGNGRAWDITIRIFRNKQSAEWYDAIMLARPNDRLTLRVADVEKNGKTYTNVTGLAEINGAPWPPETSMLASEGDWTPTEEVPL